MSFRPIFGVPKLTQDWDEEQEEKETHWTSLFYDLMIVAALNAIAEPFEEFNEDRAAQQLVPIRHLWLEALLQFLSVVNPWNFLNEFTSMIADESFVGHIAFFLHCFGVAATTAGCVGELSENYGVLANGIILSRLGLLVLCIRPLYYIERARIHMLFRCACFAVNIGFMVWGLSFRGEHAYTSFRVLLIVSTLWDWISLLGMTFLKREQRVPLHIQSYSDRIKEVTMIIFGEAIFAIILQPRSGALPETHFYAALAITLWLIYSLALQEFHIMPTPDDHALRRSVVFGFLWYYTQFFKQACLLGASIGIKRAHLLMFQHPLQPLDNDTRQLIAWGLSFTMFSVVLIRSYSFGWGRHPSNEDPPYLYRLKMSWWIILTSSGLLPQIIDNAVVERYPQPLQVLLTYGCMMMVIILCETALSNVVGMRMRKEGEDEEATYLASSKKNYESIQQIEPADEVHI